MRISHKGYRPSSRREIDDTRSMFQVLKEFRERAARTHWYELQAAQGQMITFLPRNARMS
jgi:hypothetical protein